MSPAQKMNCCLKGAEEDEVVLVQKIIDGYDVENSWRKDGKVVATDSDELPEEYDILFDLSEAGVMRIRAESDFVVVYYDEPYRQILLEQLVLMVSGNRIMDADFADIKPIMEKGCRFGWMECEKDEIQACGVKLLKEAMIENPNTDKGFFVQITIGITCGLLAANDLLIAYHEMEELQETVIIPQILEPENETEKCFVALFYPVRQSFGV